MADYDVIPNSKGGGEDATREGASRGSSHHDRQADVQKAGTRYGDNSGGGEVRLHRTYGRIRNSNRSASPTPTRRATASTSARPRARPSARCARRRCRRPRRPGRQSGRSRRPTAIAGDAPHVCCRLPQLRRVPRPARHRRGPDGRGGSRLPQRARARRALAGDRGEAPLRVTWPRRGARCRRAGAHCALRACRAREPRALSHDEWARLLRMPDRRTRRGRRDLALLHLLGSVGLRRAQAANLLVTDVDERRRASETPDCARRSRVRPAGG
jgi:Uncharacterized protein conserved in bacteria (DUF2188)